MTVANIASSIEKNYRSICEGIGRAARQADRDPASVQLLIASKMQQPDAIEILLKLGHRVFGENRVQEALEKWPDLKQRYPDVRLHLIGPLQTNKAREAIRLFDVIETVDRDRLVEALANEQGKLNMRRRYFVEVNIGSEPQKSGVLPENLDALLQFATQKHDLAVDGLMCIPPAGQQASPYFANLFKLAKKHGLSELSMGMTADYQLAIQLGATLVRVGTAIFGERQAR